MKMIFIFLFAILASSFAIPVTGSKVTRSKVTGSKVTRSKVTGSNLYRTSRDWRLIKTDHDSVHRFVLALKPSENVYKLEKYILSSLSNIDSPEYGKYLSISELQKIVAANPEYRKPNIQKLKKHGIVCEDLFDALICYGRVNTVDRVFSTNLQTFRHRSGKLVRTSFQSYKLPVYLSGVIFAEGLSNALPRSFSSKTNIKGSLIVDPGYVSREVLMRIYNLNSTEVDHSSSVGAMAFENSRDTDGFDNKTMLMSQKANGIPVNPISPKHVLGRNGLPDAESDLDTQVMYWAASDAELWYETSDAWMYMWAIDFANRQDVPDVASISWGWSEAEQCQMFKCNGTNSQTYINMTNIQFMKIVARGVTIVVASGDAGSPGRTNELCKSKKTNVGWNHINPVFPGSSPWVLSVGATYVVASHQKFKYHTPICTSLTHIGCANGTDEQMATYAETGWTSGSGFSLWSTTPSWQAQAVKSYLSSGVRLPESKYYNAGGRGYPDISAFGHNCVMRSILFGWQGVDGTSCAAPVLAGGIANLNAFQKARGKPTLGFFNPLLYKMGSEAPYVFNDVMVGDSACTEQTCCGANFGFVPSEGWDVVSGWGTPNFEKIKIYLRNH